MYLKKKKENWESENMDEERAKNLTQLLVCNKKEAQ